MNASGDGVDGWLPEWGDRDKLAAATYRELKRLLRWERPSPRSEAWKRINRMIAYHEAAAHRLSIESPEQADAHRVEVERIKEALAAERTERTVLKTLEKAARDALVAHWRDPEDPHKQAEAVMRLHLLSSDRSSGFVNLSEEERIDREFRKEHLGQPSGTLAKQAQRIVQRVIRR